MCFHTATTKEAELHEFLGSEYSITNYKHYYHVSGFNFPYLPVITNNKPKQVDILQWGLIPFWIKNAENAKDIRSKTLNAKAETVFELPSFKSSIKNKRCLILVNGFFEWQHIGKNTLPYFIYMPNKTTFTFGGIWSNWIDKYTGEVRETFSIITTQANELLSKIHNIKKRMPVIINRENWDVWLNADTEEKEIVELMKPFPDGLLRYHRVNKTIASHTINTNVPEVQDEII